LNAIKVFLKNLCTDVEIDKFFERRWRTMSIDMSSVIPLIHTNDIKIISKGYDSKRVRPVEETYESDNNDLQMDKQDLKEKNIRDNLSGVGDTYSTRGELVKETKVRQNKDYDSMTIDMVI
jgi:hypothetical protein